MTEQFPWNESEPHVTVMPGDALIAVKSSLPSSGLHYSARMAGREMGDADGVFAQFYEHLRLPDYFGWNWDALRDCLQDLHWLPAASVLLAIDDAECILPDMREERRILFRILSDSIKYWSGKADIPGQGKRSLRAMLLCEADSVASLQRQFPDTADSP